MYKRDYAEAIIETCGVSGGWNGYFTNSQYRQILRELGRRQPDRTIRYYGASHRCRGRIMKFIGAEPYASQDWPSIKNDFRKEHLEALFEYLNPRVEGEGWIAIFAE